MSDGERTSAGFSCPGLFWLPGLVAVGWFHLGGLLVFLREVRQEGVSWSLAAVASGALAIFWLVFGLVGRWAGTDAALNLLGMLAALITPPAEIGVLIWWICR